MKFGPVKVTLVPSDLAAAQLIADKRGRSLQDFISDLIRKEATIELIGWGTPAEQGATTAAPTAQPPAEVP